MSRLAVLTFTLTAALPWSGESFISTIDSSPRTSCTIRQTESSLQQIHKPSKRRTRHDTRRKIRYQQEEQPGYASHRTFSSPTISSIISYKRSSSLLHAALISDPSPNGGDKKGPGWHRRILGKISRRRGSKSSSSLPSSSIEQEEAQDGLVDTFLVYEHKDQDSGDFVVRNFDLMVPDSVLPVVQIDQETLSPEQIETQKQSNPPVIDSEYFDVAITPAKSKTTETTKDATPATSAASLTQSQTKRGLVCRMLGNILLERLGERWPIETPENLEVDVRESTDSYNNVLRLLFRGLFRADATISSDRIVFPTIRFSSIKLQMEKVTLNLLGFFQDKSNEDIRLNVRHGPYPRHLQNHRQGDPSKLPVHSVSTGKPRYPEQFDVHIEDLTMSRDDLLFSKSIKNGLRQLLINVLKDRGIRSDSIEIASIDILRNGKISCIGEAKTHFPSAPPVRFEVRTGISFGNRGHVLTFPGLEVSLNRDIGLFVPVLPTLDLDVGHNTKFRSIVIDGRKKELKIAASVTITPERTRRTQDYVQTSDAFSAIFFYDVGKWLTRLGRFSK